MKKAILLFLVLTLILPCVPVFAVSAPVVHLSFNDSEIKNDVPSTLAFSSGNVSYINGVNGKGASIDTSGYIRCSTGGIGTLLNGASGITVSAYIKNGTKTDGNLLLIRNNGRNEGLKLAKSGSTITLTASSASGEALTATYNTKESFDDWTHITVGIDFVQKRVKFYVNGEFRYYTAMAFTNNAYNYITASSVDTIGVAGLCLDEVKIFAENVPESDPSSWIKVDNGMPEQVAYRDILEENLITRFAFNEGEGNISCSEGKIKVIGKAQTTLDWIPGIEGTALQFHANEQNWLNIGNAVTRALNGKSGMTVSGWFYFNKEAGSAYDNCIMTLSAGLNAPLLRYSVYGGGLVFAETRSSASNVTGMSFYEQGRLPFGEWVHLTLSADLVENTLKLYMNGTQVEEYHLDNFTNTNYNDYSDVSFTNQSFIVNAAKDIDTIGGDPSLAGGYTHTFNGAMDEIRIYDRAMTDDEALYIYLENKNGDWLKKSEANYVKLNTISQNVVIMAAGHNEIITKKERKRIDWDDITSTPVLSGGKLMLPAKLATDVFEISTNQSISAEQVATQLGKTYYYDDCGLAVIGTADAVAKISGDKDFAKWIYDELTKLPYPQQTADHYGTRQVVRYEANINRWHSSPAILELADGTMLVSHDTAAGGSTLFRSTNNGASWTQVWYNDNVVYGSLFENKGSVYLMGVRRGKQNNVELSAVPAIYKSTDGGLTWSTPSDRNTGWLVNSSGTSAITPAHAAPTPVLKHNGRIYKAFETSANNWRGYRVCVISADENADLLKADSWTISNFVKLSDYTSQFPSGILYSDPGMCEAQPIIGRDGSIYLLARFNSAPSVDYAAVCKLTSDSTLAFDRIIKFPGGMSKFYVQYDSKTDKYIALANPNVDRDYVLQRYCLSLLVSDDLFNWEVKETLLVPNWLDNFELGTTKYAFQYPSWYFDGDDIVYAVREANVGAYNYHNGNYITVYRLKDYKKYF